MALLSELRAYLIAQGVGASGSTADWSVYAGVQPARPNRAITLYETGGFQDEMHESNPITRPTFQVEVRGNGSSDYLTVRAKVDAAQTALLNAGTTSLGWRYVTIQQQSQPLSLGLDVNQRPRIVQNYLALRSRTS